MASTEEETSTAPPAEKVEAPEAGGEGPAEPSHHPAPDYFLLGDVILRVLLLASSVAAVVVIVTSKQTSLVTATVPPFPTVSQTAKFQNSPALIYFVTALSLTGLYSIISTVGSTMAILNPSSSTSKLIIPFQYLVIFDVLLLGVVAAATGSAGAVGYIGWKGNSHTQWNQICNSFSTFCKHIVVSISLSLFASLILTLLILLSLFSLSKKIPK